MQAWFFVDLIKMGLQFRSEWKAAHPTPPGPDREEEQKWRNSTIYKVLKFSSLLCCCPLWVLYYLCCRKKSKDPYDDGQDKFGVNFKEYTAWRMGEDIGDRKLPKSYQNLSLHNAARKVKKLNDDVSNKVVGAKTAVSGAKTAVSTKTAKWKEKAVALSNKAKGQTAGGAPSAEAEDRELIVGDAMQNTVQAETVVLDVDGNGQSTTHM